MGRYCCKTKNKPYGNVKNVVISLGIMEKTWEIMSFFFFGYGRIIGIK
jgi:hypothetical protein